MKLSDRLRQEYNDWKSGDVLIEAADLLDECERALNYFLTEGYEIPKARATLAKLRGQEAKARRVM